jgi:hypothetical protein
MFHPPKPNLPDYGTSHPIPLYLVHLFVHLLTVWQYQIQMGNHCGYSRYYPSVCLEILNKKYKSLSQDNGSPHLLTPWSRVLLEKLTGFAASQEIPRIYGT